MIRVLTHVATYLVVAPPTGALGASVVVGLYQMTRGQGFDLPGTLASLADGRNLGVIYFLGAIPALVTGLLSLTWVKETRGPWGWTIAAIVGGVTGAALCCLALPLAIFIPFALLVMPGLVLGGVVGSGVAAAAAEGLVALLGPGSSKTAAPLPDMRA